MTALTVQVAPLVQNAAITENDMMLRVTTGKRPVKDLTKKNSLEGEPVWTSGLAAHLSEKITRDHWCNDCWVTVQFTAKFPGKYKLLARANVGDFQNIKDGEKIYGVAQYDEKILSLIHI